MNLKFSHRGIDFEGVAEGGIRTCIAVQKFNLMFDLGILPIEKLQLDHVLITHGHLDHSAGIPYYISQRSLKNMKPPHIYVNESVYEPLMEIMKLYSKIEHFNYSYHIHLVKPNEIIHLNKRISMKAIQTFHRIPSHGYTLFESVKKLKPEFSHFSETDILNLKATGAELTEEKTTPLISFSGDTKIEYVLSDKDVLNSKILFLECTYIDDDRNVERARNWGHTHLDEIITHAKEFQNEKIVLMHFSKRYSYKYIKDIMKKKLPEDLIHRIHCFIP